MKELTFEEIEWYRSEYKMADKDDVEEIDIFCDRVKELLYRLKSLEN